ncbi:hemerythrin domain-containing protein [Celeribacter litoreus]|uniref:hemerythrin domain-containing protein n=1 Tax=Celeribacter litoreus TaxID=2876714 RepID=UPI001CC9F394|nr:hemerythrin domain-containing protein [Celeribacter litoreus]MCA0044359.1 hemerythrin domain-containing protein [Celeribacter litoreus]
MSGLGPWQSVTEALGALHEAERPKAPKLEDATDMDRRQGRMLAEIHKMHLSELAMTRRLLTQIETGGAEPGALREALDEMAMTRNFRAFGNLCGRSCQIINGHHNIEEYDTFVRVEAGGHAGINAVVTKLRAEHKVIHALIEHLYSAAVDLVQDPTEEHYRMAVEKFEQFEAVVKSHFGYEEVELEEALGLFNAL